jgi:peptidoglycan/LPS O-acetylase OafA/YrhL
MPTRRIFYNLEALRGICALVIALSHVPWINVTLYASPVLHGWIFVDLFFVLSGFVIAYNYIDKVDRNSVKYFVIRRLYRLVPLHQALLLACLVLDLLHAVVLPILLASTPAYSEIGVKYWADVVWSALLLQGMGLTELSRPNAPSWSISVEVFAYLTFAIICIAIRRQRRGLAMATVAAVAFLTLQILQNWTGLVGPMEYRFFRCLYSFGLGVAVAEIAVRTPISIPQRWNATLQILLWLIVIGLLYSIGRHDLRSAAMPPIFATIILLSVWDQGSNIKILLERPFGRRLGELSYSIYMVHGFVGNCMGFVVNRMSSGRGWVFDISRPQLPLGIGEMLVLVYVGLVLVISSATFAWIEKPWREAGQRRTSVRRPPVIVPAA